MQESRRFAILSRDPRTVESLARLVERTALSSGLYVPDQIIGSTSKIPKTAQFNYRMTFGNEQVGRFYYELINGSFRGELDLSRVPQEQYYKIMEQLKRYKRILQPVS